MITSKHVGIGYLMSLDLSCYYMTCFLRIKRTHVTKEAIMVGGFSSMIEGVVKPYFSVRQS